MKGRVFPTSNHSVVFVKSAEKASIEHDNEVHLKSVSRESSSGKKEQSPKIITICTLCGRFKGFRVRRNRFILSCTAISLLALLIGIIIVFYAIVPAIVKSTIEKAELSFRSVNIGDIGNNGFRLRAQLELSRTGSISAKILPPLIINVDNVGTVRNDDTISIVGNPNRPTIVPIDSPFSVSNLAAFHRFTRSLIFEPHVIWHLTA
ncbi:unnamed protein product, partial [Rotaria magnacalcarata]